MEIRNLSLADFDGITLRQDGLWLVDFTAAWCAPCRTLDPILHTLADELAGDVHIARVDVEVEPELTTRFGVVSMPSLLLFRDHVVIDQKVGSMPRSKILAWLDPVRRAASPHLVAGERARL